MHAKLCHCHHCKSIRNTSDVTSQRGAAGNFNATERGRVELNEIPAKVLEKVCQYFYYKLQHQNSCVTASVCQDVASTTSASPMQCAHTHARPFIVAAACTFAAPLDVLRTAFATHRCHRCVHKCTLMHSVTAAQRVFKRLYTWWHAEQRRPFQSFIYHPR